MSAGYYSLALFWGYHYLSGEKSSSQPLNIDLSTISPFSLGIPISRDMALWSLIVLATITMYGVTNGLVIRVAIGDIIESSRANGLIGRATRSVLRPVRPNKKTLKIVGGNWGTVEDSENTHLGFRIRGRKVDLDSYYLRWNDDEGEHLFTENDVLVKEKTKIYAGEGEDEEGKIFLNLEEKDMKNLREDVRLTDGDDNVAVKLNKPESSKDRVLTFLRNFQRPFTAEDIAEKGHIERNVVRNALPELEADDLIEQTDVGGTAVYWFNDDDTTTTGDD